MSIASRARGLADRLNAYALAGLKAGLGYPNPGWAPTPSSQVAAATGVMVTDERARGVAAWTMGVRVLAEDVAGLPLIVYRRGTDAAGRPTKERDPSHPAYRILHDSPNPEMTAFVFRETLMGHLVAWGNAYAEKELDGDGQVVRLWPLRPDRMAVRIDPDTGLRTYDYTVRPGTAPVRLPRSRVFHIPGLGFDGLVGYSPLRMARDTLGTAIALREYGARVLERDARPSIALRHPLSLSDAAKERIRDSWVATYGGFTNAGRTAVLEEGMDVKEMGFPPEDIQFLESQRFQVTEVARFLRLAPHKLNDLEHATFSNIEEQNIDHATSALRAWCVRWEQQADKDLLGGSPDHFAEHLLDAFLRGRTLERYQAYAVAVQNKAMTPNEWRALENWDPVPWGDDPVETPNNSAQGAHTHEPGGAA